MKVKLFFLSVVFLATSADAAFFEPDEVDIRLTGRWDQSNPAQPWAQAKGTSIIFQFSGSSLSGNFSASTTDYLRIIIDNDAAGSLKIPISSSNVSYPLVTGLEDEEAYHTIEIVKETDAGRWTIHGFEADSLSSPALPRPDLRLVFYGDSNLAGYSLEHEQNQGGRHLQGSYYGYAGIVSRMFGAEYSNISRSGASIRSLHASFDRIEWYTPGSLWDFNEFQPDAVVINIGANDVGRPKAKFKKDYHALLDDMRAVYPNAHIMLYNAWGWDYDEPANFIDEVIDARNDSDMSYATFPWIFEQWHGCEYDHSGMAHVLAAHLNTIFGWTPGVADVMNGYGAEGNVANGGFEEIAPFGGYGWRYSEDDGVGRVEGGGDGYFLRLVNGAASHQPNPAENGQSFTVTVLMRGAENGDQVHMTMDFRDQEMWTAPLSSKTLTKTLSTTWQEFTMSATAPTGTSRPVFHTRLTFQAAAGSTVDIDDVSMSVGAGIEECQDTDGDGYGMPGSVDCAYHEADCDDGNDSVNPGVSEFCGNSIDDNCNGEVDGESEGCLPPTCADGGESCVTGSDCCSGACSKGKPSRRVCQ